MRSSLGIFKLLIILLISVYSSYSYSDGDGSIIFENWYESKKQGVSSVKFEQYNEICGSCHFPYQPGLLPAVSWEKIMLNVDRHFGVSLKLSPINFRTMTRYLLDNSAGHVNDEISNNILRSFKYNPVVIRVTKTPYFEKVHGLPDSMETVKNIGQCNQCHQDAIKGVY